MRSPRHPDGFRSGAGPKVLAAPRQRSFDDLEIPLHEVTFCALDLETTGGSARDCEIVEIGAVKSRGGEVLGTLDTLVQPSVDLPVEIQMLTGIRPSMLTDARPLPEVLPSLVEFVRGTVLVAHNARFDHSFLQAATVSLDYEDLDVQVLDTAKLARRILKGDVPNVRLQTLAAFFRTSHTPNHRAFPDAAACLEVLWGLLERAAAYGVTTLADLLDLQRRRSNPHFEKVRLARDLPRSRGVYLFRNARREIVYIGKATNLRARVRSYFTTDDRKRISDLLTEIASVETIPCTTDVEAEALEARLIERHTPRYNRRGVRRRAPVYLKLTKERHPRFSVVTAVKDDDCLYVGPLSNRRRAQAVATTLSGLFGIRTCTQRLGTCEPCSLYDLGTCAGPCTGCPDDIARHDEALGQLRADLMDGLTASKHRVTAKLARLVDQGRFEEAAGHRDAYAELVRTVDRARSLAALAQAGRVALDTPDGRITLDGGRVVLSREAPGALFADPVAAEPARDPAPLALDPNGLEERRVVASWLGRATDIRMVHADRPLGSPWPRPQPLDRIDLSE